MSGNGLFLHYWRAEMFHKGIKWIYFITFSWLAQHVYLFMLFSTLIFVWWFFVYFKTSPVTTTTKWQEKWESKRNERLSHTTRYTIAADNRGKLTCIPRYIGKRNKYCPSFLSLIILYFFHSSTSLSLSLPLSLSLSLFLSLFVLSH